MTAVVDIGGGKKLEATAAASYERMKAAGMPTGSVVSAYRTYAEQKRLYQLYLAGKGNLAAKPGTSNHEGGLAMDVTAGSKQQKWLVANSTKHGWVRDVPSEAWHFHYIAAKDQVNPTPTLRRGDKGAAVTRLQTALNAAGYSVGAADGIFEVKTELAVRSLQKAANLTADGIVGPKTWAALSAPPLAAKPVIILSGNMQAEGGNRTQRIQHLLDQAKAGVSIFCIQDATEAIRDDIRSGMPGGKNRWKVRPTSGRDAVIWDSTIWSETAEPKQVTFSPRHGAIMATLTGPIKKLHVASIHVRSTQALINSGIKTEAKQIAAKKADAKKGIALLPKAGVCVIAGDWNTRYHDEVANAAGLCPLSQAWDTLDKPGDQRIDRIWGCGVSATKAELVNPGSGSDHKWLKITLG
jgi:peptidoglycan hydrolase-like protein with peptidoglycan-binding domain